MVRDITLVLLRKQVGIDLRALFGFDKHLLIFSLQLMNTLSANWRLALALILLPAAAVHAADDQNDPRILVPQLRAEIDALKAENAALKKELGKQTAVPSEKEAAHVVSEIIREKSQGRLKLITFKKMDGVARLNGYFVQFNGTMQFTQPCTWNPVTFAASGDISTAPIAARGKYIPDFGDSDVRAGETVSFIGAVNTVKAESGWGGVIVGIEKVTDFGKARQIAPDFEAGSTTAPNASANVSGKAGGPSGNLYAEVKIKNNTLRSIKVYLDDEATATELKGKEIMFRKYLANTTHKIKLETKSGKISTYEFPVDEDGTEIPID